MGKCTFALNKWKSFSVDKDLASPFRIMAQRFEPLESPSYVINT